MATVADPPRAFFSIGRQSHCHWEKFSERGLASKPFIYTERVHTEILLLIAEEATVFVVGVLNSNIKVRVRK